jgi:hypothetical protein
MKSHLKTNTGAENCFSPNLMAEETLEKHLLETHVHSLESLSMKQRKKEASKPIYLVRYE